jgi:hypothetical protein
MITMRVWPDGHERWLPSLVRWGIPGATVGGVGVVVSTRLGLPTPLSATPAAIGMGVFGACVGIAMAHAAEGHLTRANIARVATLALLMAAWPVLPTVPKAMGLPRLPAALSQVALFGWVLVGFGALHMTRAPSPVAPEDGRTRRLAWMLLILLALTIVLVSAAAVYVTLNSEQFADCLV